MCWDAWLLLAFVYVSFTEGIRDVSGPGALRAEDEGRLVGVGLRRREAASLGNGRLYSCLVSCYQSYNNGSKPISS